jgi:hypothetical protein
VFAFFMAQFRLHAVAPFHFRQNTIPFRARRRGKPRIEFFACGLQFGGNEAAHESIQPVPQLHAHHQDQRGADDGHIQREPEEDAGVERETHF